MVEISKSGSGEGSVWVTGRGYSTRKKGSGIRGQGSGPAPPAEAWGGERVKGKGKRTKGVVSC